MNMIVPILGLVRFLLALYNLLVIAYVLITWVRIPANKWTELLRSLVEPALKVTRKAMKRFLPGLCKPGIDWSPAVLFVAIIVLRIVIRWLM